MQAVTAELTGLASGGITVKKQSQLWFSTHPHKHNRIHFLPKYFRKGSQNNVFSRQFT